MSEVLIKGMKMPKSCPCELIGVGYDMYCSFAYGVPSRVREYYECCEKETRPDWCPIIGVPPHGRLIDADATIADIRGEILEHQMNGMKGTPFYIEDLRTMWQRLEDEEMCPTIIPAEPCKVKGE